MTRKVEGEEFPPIPDDGRNAVNRDESWTANEGGTGGLGYLGDAPGSSGPQGNDSPDDGPDPGAKRGNRGQPTGCGLLVLGLLLALVAGVVLYSNGIVGLPNGSKQGHAILSVSPTGPTMVNCSAPAQTYPPITLRNTGAQMLSWQSGVNNPAVALTPASGSLAPGQAQTITLSGGPSGVTTSITISSNGGIAYVVYTCLPPAPPPQLVVSPSGPSAVNCSATPVNYPSITVRNTGGQSLIWQASTSNPNVRVSPASGTVASNQSQTLSVSATGLSGSVNVTVTSNGGSATVMFECLVG